MHAQGVPCLTTGPTRSCRRCPPIQDNFSSWALHGVSDNKVPFVSFEKEKDNKKASADYVDDDGSASAYVDTGEAGAKPEGKCCPWPKLGWRESRTNVTARKTSTRSARCAEFPLASFPRQKDAPR